MVRLFLEQLIFLEWPSIKRRLDDKAITIKKHMKIEIPPTPTQITPTIKYTHIG